MGLGVPHFSARRFSSNPASLLPIRRFTHRTLAQWGQHSCVEDTTLVVSELVANAVRHALSHQAGCHGWLGLMNTAHTIICAVQDPSRHPPLPRATTAHDTGGRGLLIIDELSHDWGYSLHGNTGKTVWALVPITIAGVTTGAGNGCGTPKLEGW
ncbi:ATP-binding protein [Streptomyces sp. Rer75]|uniref:ATP-binding protein n=1 Tax=Streptomyces sp. Rer75 TaxID=2750011 RepID=UPI0015D05296|nr:ATP-binding protein [Streptomyces sp. Rer75]